MLDKNGKVLRNAILWCDARTQKQCDEITTLVGKKRLIEINANPALTGFTAPKILWVRENEPEIYAAIRKNALLENVVIDGSGKVDYNDASKTENTRVSYPIEHIENHEKSLKAGHPKNIIFLTADAFGVYCHQLAS